MSKREKSQEAGGSTAMRRTSARLAAVQAVYQMRAGGQDARQVVGEYRLFRLGKPVDGAALAAPDDTLFASIVSGLESRKDDVMSLVSGALEGRHKGDAAALEPLLLGIMMCGAYELLAHHDVDVPIIIADYLDITHSFYDGGESKIVNAVLDRIAKNVREEPKA